MCLFLGQLGSWFIYYRSLQASCCMGPDLFRCCLQVVKLSRPPAHSQSVIDESWKLLTDESLQKLERYFPILRLMNNMKLCLVFPLFSLHWNSTISIPKHDTLHLNTLSSVSDFFLCCYNLLK